MIPRPPGVSPGSPARRPTERSPTGLAVSRSCVFVAGPRLCCASLRHRYGAPFGVQGSVLSQALTLTESQGSTVVPPGPPSGSLSNRARRALSAMSSTLWSPAGRKFSVVLSFGACAGDFVVSEVEVGVGSAGRCLAHVVAEQCLDRFGERAWDERMFSGDQRRSRSVISESEAAWVLGGSRVS